MREFRALHESFAAAGVAVAGVSFDPVERARVWAERLALPYPLLSDAERRAALAFGLIRRIGIGGWNLEIMKRATLLADRRGIIRAAWESVRIKGHPRTVLEAARLLPGLESEGAGPGLQPPA